MWSEISYHALHDYFFVTVWGEGESYRGITQNAKRKVKRVSCGGLFGSSWGLDHTPEARSFMLSPRRTSLFARSHEHAMYLQVGWRVVSRDYKVVHCKTRAQASLPFLPPAIFQSLDQTRSYVVRAADSCGTPIAGEEFRPKSFHIHDRGRLDRPKETQSQTLGWKWQGPPMTVHPASRSIMITENSFPLECGVDTGTS